MPSRAAAPSYGEQFGNLIHHAYPGDDYDDLMSGRRCVDRAGQCRCRQPVRDRRVGRRRAHAWIVGKTDRFRAAVVAKPVINWASFVLTADCQQLLLQVLVRAQPVGAAAGILAPLAAVAGGQRQDADHADHGEADYRTPIEESEQYYQALKLRKIDTVMVRIPEASHGGMVARPSNLIAKVDNILAWFGKYRKKPGAGKP
jgi:acylaminoacyl-peptidase